jgi:hypothetical protein
MRSAIDQSAIVLMNRKMNVERGVTVSDTGCSSAAGMLSIILKERTKRKEKRRFSCFRARHGTSPSGLADFPDLPNFSSCRKP